MRKKVWIWFIRKTTKPLTAISVAVTILVIFNFTIDMVIASSKIIVELNETKITTIENPSRRIDDRPSITDRQTESGTRDTERTDESIEEKIRETFPDNANEMTKLFSCESGLIADKAGDLSLTFEHNGEILGSSHGIGQIRTGGNERGVVWNRAEKYGMTADEFIKALEDPDYNLKICKEVYDSAGYNAWYNCSKKIGLI